MAYPIFLVVAWSLLHISEDLGEA